MPHWRIASSSWSPHLKKDRAGKKKVQKRVSRMITGLVHLPYKVKLQLLGLSGILKKAPPHRIRLRCIKFCIGWIERSPFPLIRHPNQK